MFGVFLILTCQIVIYSFDSAIQRLTYPFINKHLWGERLKQVLVEGNIYTKGETEISRFTMGNVTKFTRKNHV